MFLKLGFEILVFCSLFFSLYCREILLRASFYACFQLVFLPKYVFFGVSKLQISAPVSAPSIFSLILYFFLSFFFCCSGFLEKFFPSSFPRCLTNASVCVWAGSKWKGSISLSLFSLSHLLVAASRSPYSVLYNFLKGPLFTFLLNRTYLLHSHNLCGDIFSVFSVCSLIFLAGWARNRERAASSLSLAVHGSVILH